MPKPQLDQPPSEPTLDGETQAAFLRLLDDYLPRAWEQAAELAGVLEAEHGRATSTLTIKAKVSLTGSIAKVDHYKVAFTSCAVGDLNEIKQVSTYETHLPRFERDLNQPELL